MFTEELERQMAAMPAFSQAASSYAHWCGGYYLITTVSQAEARIELTINRLAHPEPNPNPNPNPNPYLTLTLTLALTLAINSAEQLENMRERLGPELSFAMHGERQG